jgi:hypothetical protein
MDISNEKAQKLLAEHKQQQVTMCNYYASIEESIDRIEDETVKRFAIAGKDAEYAKRRASLRRAYIMNLGELANATLV